MAACTFRYPHLFRNFESLSDRVIHHLACCRGGSSAEMYRSGWSKERAECIVHVVLDTTSVASNTRDSISDFGKKHSARA